MALMREDAASLVSASLSSSNNIRVFRIQSNSFKNDPIVENEMTILSRMPSQVQVGENVVVIPAEHP